MRLPTFFLSTMVVATAPKVVHAQTPETTPTPAADASAYCDFVEGVAASEAALEMSPTLFGTAGVVSGADVSPGGSVLGPTTRVIAGASYSVGGLYRGIAKRGGAGAECRRYRTISELRAFLETNRDGLTRRSLAARLAVLEQALPEAEEMLRASSAALAQSHTTVEQNGALRLRVDALQALVAQTRADLESLSHAPAVSDRPIADVLREHDEAEADVEEYDARVRQSRAWDVGVRGGYDQIFGTSVPYTPLFALVTVNLNVGGLFQPSAEDRAARGRVAWARQQIEGVDDRVQQALVRLRATRDAERKRRDETQLLLADLEARYKTLRALSGEKVADYAQYMWFDLVRTRAEFAYLGAHVADLERLTGADRRAP